MGSQPKIMNLEGLNCEIYSKKIPREGKKKKNSEFFGRSLKF